MFNESEHPIENKVRSRICCGDKQPTQRCCIEMCHICDRNSKDTLSLKYYKTSSIMFLVRSLRSNMMSGQQIDETRERIYHRMPVIINANNKRSDRYDNIWYSYIF